jgi:hypothetical protein
MNNGVAVYGFGIGLTTVLSFIVVLYLNRHVRNLLIDLCGTKERADFWRAFSNVVLFLLPLLFVLDFRPEDAAWIWNLTAELKRGLLGLGATVVVLGIVIGLSIPRRRTPAPSIP